MLVYAADQNAGARHHRSVSLLERAILRRNCIQPLQSLCEFFNVATRKIGTSPEVASAFVAGWRAVIPIVPARPDDLGSGRVGVARLRLSVWDAKLWADVPRAGGGFCVGDEFSG